MILELCRIYKGKRQTLGQFDVINDAGEIVFTCFTLELPDLNNDGIENNEKRQSCIPDGEYPVVHHNSPKFGACFWVKDVPGRDAILIHPGTHKDHTLGCILPGTEQKDITGDGLLDNVGSKKAMAELLKYDITKIKIYTRP